MDEKSAHRASTALAEHPLGAGGSVRMPLCEFLATYAPVNCSSWNEAVRCMTADPIDSETIAVLAADLVDNDQFRRPIVVDPDTWMVANGMHRCVAEIVTNAACIDVTTTPEVLNELVVVDLAIVKPDFADIDELLDDPLYALRSFPVGDSWAETDALGFNGVGGGYIVASGCWYWPHADADRLVEALVERAAAYGLAATVRSVRCERLDQGDDKVGCTTPADDAEHSTRVFL